MRITTFSFSLAAAFATGLLSAPFLHDVLPEAHAQAAEPQAQMIDLMAIKHADLPKTSNPEMNARGIVVTENATLGLQSGNVAKHMHPKTLEIQYIVEGSGAMWLGNERHEFKPGTLIVIPKGTAHGGTKPDAGSAPIKAIALKTPPQAAEGGTKMLP